MNYFTNDELKCRCCGENKFNLETLSKLNRLRQALGRPIVLNSAYRCEAYNKKIGATQTHATGRAVDIKCSHRDAYDIISLADVFGFTGIGVSQKGDIQSRFVHLDDLPESEGRPRPHVWSY
jgi:uncharacterized protein YcbK (DUF882 family)